MAHQAHNIPWSLLASNLRWVSAGPTSGCTNLRPGTKKQRGKELMFFLEAFSRNIAEHSACERRKYPETYDPPKPNDVVLDAATATKIGPTVRRWRHHYGSKYTGPSWDCPHDEHDGCQCHIIPRENRQLSAFLREYRASPCHLYWQYNEEYHFNVEIVKTLLLYGEMEPILRIYAHPGVNLKYIWRSNDWCSCGVSLSPVASFEYAGNCPLGPLGTP